MAQWSIGNMKRVRRLDSLIPPLRMLGLALAFIALPIAGLSHPSGETRTAAAIRAPGEGSLARPGETAGAGATSEAAASSEANAGEIAVDTTSSRLIRQFTSSPEFLSPLVADVPESDAVPSPRDFLGYVVGTPKKLTYYADIVRYFRALDEVSPRLSLFSMGKSFEGKEMVVAAIASETSIGRLEQIKDDLAALADPRTTTELDARSIAERTKPVYFITAGLHSPECGPPEMTMELAYRLVTSEQEIIREIRENLVVLICPVLETDGRERMVDWYYRYTIESDDWEDSPPRSPPYWGHYTYHDNNREGLQNSQPLTRNYYRTFFEWHPTVSLDLHESVPLLYVSQGTGPYNMRVDPVTIGEWQWFSSYEVAELAKFGMPGVWTWGFYTGWYPGYLLWVTINHNALGRFYETFGNAGANTFERKLEDRTFAGQKVTSRQWYRPWPPEKKVRWGLRDNTNYMQTGVLTSLSLAAANGEKLLFNAWKKGWNSLERGRQESPAAWLVPEEQRDLSKLAHMINLVRGHGIELHRAADSFEAEGREFPAGTYVVRMDQPYRDFAQNLFETQTFPKDAPHLPYDDVAWTFGSMFGVETFSTENREVLETPMEPLTSEVAYPGKLSAGPVTRFFLMENAGQRNLASARFALEKSKVYALAKERSIGGKMRAAGSWILPADGSGSTSESTIEAIARRWGLDFEGVDEELPDALIELDLPRIAVYHSWLYTQDSGWLRFTFDTAGIPYTLINKDQVRKGSLERRFDLVIIPTQSRRNGLDLVQGIDPRWGPMPYTKTDRFRHHGIIDSSPDITGGLGYEGLQNLERFIARGGVLVTLGSASLLPVEMGLVRDVRVYRSSKLRNPGSFVTTRVLRRDSPIAYGYETVGQVFRTNLPLLTVPDRLDSLVVLKYGAALPESDEEETEAGGSMAESSAAGASGAEEEGGGAEDGKSEVDLPPLCRSGVVFAEEELVDKPAIIDRPVGKGRVVLFTFNPMHRYQNHADFNYLYNVILAFND